MAGFATELRAFRMFRDAFLRNWSDVDGGDTFNLHFPAVLFDIQDCKDVKCLHLSSSNNNLQRGP